MIVSFACNETELLYLTGKSTKFQSCAKVAVRKLDQLQIAVEIKDLRIPPGNHLEALSGDRAGQYSIRINDQWQLCFRWQGENAYDVEIVDYH